MTIAPQVGGIAEGGRLIFLYEGQRYDFDDCKIDRASFRRNAAGQIWRLSIFDRRWKWAFGEISGWYNQRHPDGAIKDETRKTLHELAVLCIEAMGESVAESRIADLPADSFPEVKWDFDVPARALASMVGDRGYRLLNQLDQRLAIRKVGEGAELPPGAIIDGSATVDPPETPDAVAAVGQPDLYEADLPLQAVGKDRDGSLKPLKDLAYAPDANAPNGGFTAGMWPAYPGFAESDRELAQQSIFFLYQVDLSTPVRIPGYVGPGGGLAADLVADRDLLILHTEQVDTRRKANTPPDVFRRERKPARVSGVWCRRAGPPFNNTQAVLAPVADGDDAVVDRPFKLDLVNQLVTFEDPMFKNDGGGGAAGNGSVVNLQSLSAQVADLRLRTAVNVRHRDTGAIKRYVRERQIGQLGTETRYIQTPELVIKRRTHIYARYGVPPATDGFNPPLRQKGAEIDAEADQAIDGAIAEYEQTNPQVNRYIGLIAAELDGAIQQIVLSIGRSGATTLVARNDEDLTETISYRQRRKLDEQREDAELRRQRAAAIKQAPVRNWADLLALLQ